MRAARVVWVSLLLLAAARGVAALAPSMWAWGINVQRFLSLPAAWVPWAACLLTLLPGVGERLSGPLGRLGSWLVDRRGAQWIVALGVALVVWSLPDRTWFTGDFQLRQGATETGSLGGVYTQSLPGETLLNRLIPARFASSPSADPNVALRIIGAAAAWGLVVVSLRLVRAWRLNGIAATTSASLIVFGGYLVAFTGLGKPAAVMCLLEVLVLLGCFRFVERRGGGLLGISLAMAVVTHRGALLLIPLWLVALALRLRAGNLSDWRSRADLCLAVLPPLLAGAILAPSIWAIAQAHDLPQHIAPHAVRSTGLLATAFAARHLLDLANLLVFYVPGLLILTSLASVGGLRGLRGTQKALIVALSLPCIPLLLFVHPMQGVFRDLEVFAMAGLSFAILAAYVIGSALQGRLLPAWIAPALMLAAAAPPMQWLLHFHDSARGLQRIRAFALEDPRRSDDERARLWDTIAYSAFRSERWDLAVEASEHAARYAPHPRALMMLAIARTYTGDHRAAERVYIDLAARMPEDPLVWVGLGGAALRLGDSLEARRAIARLEAYDPQGREARMIRRHLRTFPRVWPATSELPPAGAAD